MRFSFLTLVALLGLSAACTTGDPAQVEANSFDPAVRPALKVRFVPAEQREVNDEVPATGSLLADETSSVSLEVAGRASRIHVDVGDFVQAGDVLVELDTRELKLERDRAAAALDEALARINAKDPAHLPAIEEVAEVRQAQALQDDAELKYGRARELLKKGVFSQSQVDDARTNFQVALTRYESTVAQIRNQLASIRSFQASLALAEKRLSDATLRAPISGYVDERLVSPGEYVQANTVVFRIVQSQRLKLQLELQEREADAVRVGLPIRFEVDAFPGREFEGRITRIRPSVNEQTRTFLVEAEVPNNQHGTVLKPGFFARARVLAGRKKVVLVPEAAVYSLSGVNKVFVAQGDHVEAREIKARSAPSGFVEVTQGVSPGELVAVTLINDLSDGEPVQIVRADQG
jgi:multidrug efflux pump subunit AcrA (membrane-fusion protein)